MLSRMMGAAPQNDWMQQLAGAGGALSAGATNPGNMLGGYLGGMGNYRRQNPAQPPEAGGAAGAAGGNSPFFNKDVLRMIMMGMMPGMQMGGKQPFMDNMMSPTGGVVPGLMSQYLSRG